MDEQIDSADGPLERSNLITVAAGGDVAPAAISGQGRRIEESLVGDRSDSIETEQMHVVENVSETLEIQERSQNDENSMDDSSDSGQMHDSDISSDAEPLNEEAPSRFMDMMQQAENAEGTANTPPPDLVQFGMIDMQADVDSNSSDIVFDDEPPVRNGHWNIPAGRVYAAITELLTESSRGNGSGGGPGDSGGGGSGGVDGGGGGDGGAGGGGGGGAAAAVGDSGGGGSGGGGGAAAASRGGGSNASNQIGHLLNPETHMQYMRRLLFRVGVTTFRDNRHIAALNAQLEAAEREEEPVQVEEPENPIRFDTNLAAEHSYLGSNMSRVSGVNYLEEGQQYNLMLFMHQHLLFPGELLPFIISHSLIESDIDEQNGLLFGVCFPFMNERSSEANILYGVTCQLYEKGTDNRGNTLVKSRALQRFVINSSALSGPPPFITMEPQAKCYGPVRILPEIYLPEPLQCVNMGSMHRFRDNDSMAQQYKRFQAASTPWPAIVYSNYSTNRVVDMARAQLVRKKVEAMPTDPVRLSFWLVRNLYLSEKMTRTIFVTDSVNLRMKLIENTFKQDAIFVCRYCGNRIARCNQLFPMSKHGVQTQYCNSAGYIHEINTVYNVVRTSVTYSGAASTEFSWFPGYQWQIILCKICSHHIGWEFTSLDPNLIPKSFFGISRSTVCITTSHTNPPAVIYRNFMQLARQDV